MRGDDDSRDPGEKKKARRRREVHRYTPHASMFQRGVLCLHNSLVVTVGADKGTRGGEKGEEGAFWLSGYLATCVGVVVLIAVVVVVVLGDLGRSARFADAARAASRSPPLGRCGYALAHLCSQ